MRIIVVASVLALLAHPCAGGAAEVAKATRALGQCLVLTPPAGMRWGMKLPAVYEGRPAGDYKRLHDLHRKARVSYVVVPPGGGNFFVFLPAVAGLFRYGLLQTDAESTLVRILTYVHFQHVDTNFVGRAPEPPSLPLRCHGQLDRSQNPLLAPEALFNTSPDTSVTPGSCRHARGFVQLATDELTRKYGPATFTSPDSASWTDEVGNTIGVSMRESTDRPRYEPYSKSTERRILTLRWSVVIDYRSVRWTALLDEARDRF